MDVAAEMDAEHRHETADTTAGESLRRRVEDAGSGNDGEDQRRQQEGEKVFGRRHGAPFTLACSACATPRRASRHNALRARPRPSPAPTGARCATPPRAP